MSHPAVPIRHPLEGCAAAVSAALDEAAGASPVFLAAESKAHVLVELSRAIARLEGLRAAVLAVAGDVAEVDAARSPGSWLAHHARLERPEGRRLQQLADSLDRRHPRVAVALVAGEISRSQAEVISTSVDDLPGDVDADLRARAETHLLEQAGEFGPAGLRRLGHRILDVVAPEAAEEHERRALERHEQAARDRMRVTRRDLGDGLVRVTADLPVLHADLLTTVLHAWASPRRDHLPPGGDSVGGRVDRRDPESGRRLSHPRLLAQGFCSLLERLPTEAVPARGGGTVTLLVTIDHDRLRDHLGAADLASGHRISVGEARRLACGAGILPMVLGGASQPLDVGRRRRFHTPAMRTALAVRDRECRAAGCDIPAAWCEAHHTIPWAAAHGPTNLDDGLLLCGYHHHRAHDPGYRTDRLPNGDVRFHRRT